MNCYVTLLGCMLAVLSCVQAAELLTASEGVNLLRKMGSAARTMNYSGIYLYRQGESIETFRISHLFDANGEQEKRESLDGLPREFIRNNDQIIAYSPDMRPMALDRRTANKFFPGVIADQVVDVLNNYTLRKLDTDRVAGQECQIIVLEPKDKLRNLHRLCVEPTSGLLLRTAMYATGRREAIEQFSFLQLEIGGAIDKNTLRPTYANKSSHEVPAGTTLLETLARAAAEAGKKQPAIANVALASDVPNGFRLLKQLRSAFPGKPNPVNLYVFTDGVAIVSVFVEPAENGFLSIPASQGAVNVYSRQQNGWIVTALGEVPAQTVQLFTQAFLPR